MAVVDPARNRDRFAGLPLLRDLPPRDSFDAVLVTDVIDPQACFATALRRLPAQHVLTPPLLHVSRGRMGQRAAGRPARDQDLIETGDAA